MSLDEQENPLTNKQPTAEEWDKSVKVLTIEAIPCVPLPNHHVSF